MARSQSSCTARTTTKPNMDRRQRCSSLQRQKHINMFTIQRRVLGVSVMFVLALHSLMIGFVTAQQQQSPLNETVFPTFRPTSQPEPNCVSLQGKPMKVDRYVAFRVVGNQSEGADEEAAIVVSRLEDAILASYQQVVTCPQKGSFRQVDRVEIVQQTQSSFSSLWAEYLVRFTGSCEGCVDQRLFFDDGGLEEGSSTTTLVLSPPVRGRTLAQQSNQVPSSLVQTQEGQYGDEGGVPSLERLLQDLGPCFCPSPSQTEFLRLLETNLLLMSSSALDQNETIAPSTTATEIVITGMVELEETGNASQACMLLDESANTEAGGDAPPLEQQSPTIFFNTTLEVRLALTTPSAANVPLSEDEKQHLISIVWEAFDFQSSWTARTCDPWQREIVGIEVELGSAIAGRRTNAVEHSQPHLRTSKGTTTPRELNGVFDSDPFAVLTTVLFHIEASCIGCEESPHLFGEVVTMEPNATFNDTDTMDEPDGQDALFHAPCLCPVGDYDDGVPLEALGSTLDALAIDLPFIYFVYDIAEVEAVPCPVEMDTFSSFVVVEFDLNASASLLGPTLEEIVLLQDAFVASYNLLSRQFCDPIQRRLTSAQVVRISEIFIGEPLVLEFEATGTCRGCRANTTLYDSISFLQNISLVPGSSRRHRDLLSGMLFESRHATDKDAKEGLPRRMQAIDDRLVEDTLKTCYCDVVAIQEQGPSEVEIISAYSTIIDGLNLPSIQSVGECKFLTIFQSSVILNFKGNISAATEDQLQALGQGFIDSYNRVNSGDQVCDRQFRRLANFRLDANITLNEEFLAGGGLGGGYKNATDDLGVNRRLQLSKTKLERRFLQQTDDVELEQELETNSSGWPTMRPTGVPTFFVNEVPTLEAPTAPDLALEDTSINILLYVSGTCRGCETSFGLFDQGTARRALQEAAEEQSSTSSQIELDFVTATGSCYCPPGSIKATPSEEEIVEAFKEAVDELKEEGAIPFIEEVQELEEVAVVQCVVETNGFATTLSVDFFAYFDLINSNDMEAIATTFNTTYNELAQGYCDSLFRRSLGVGNVMYGQVSLTDEFGISRVRFTLTIDGQCRNCQDNDPLLATNGVVSSRRAMAEEDLCFCDSQTLGTRPPSEREFEDEFRVAWDGVRRRARRHLGTENVLDLAPDPIGGNWQSPAPTILPSNAPSSTPTSHPSGSPSEKPSLHPSMEPSAFPSPLPSSFPSSFPSTFPSLLPSTTPLTLPSHAPSSEPSRVPTGEPSVSPSSFPSSPPSQFPSESPSTTPSTLPSIAPSRVPSGEPSVSPSSFPSSSPSQFPTSPFPSTNPSTLPSIAPSRVPSGEPSVSPSSFPTSPFPSTTPSTLPSSVPTSEPSKIPTGEPSVPPSQFPTSPPSQFPSSEPTPPPTARILEKTINESQEFGDCPFGQRQLEAVVSIATNDAFWLDVSIMTNDLRILYAITVLHPERADAVNQRGSGMWCRPEWPGIGCVSTSDVNVVSINYAGAGIKGGLAGCELAQLKDSLNKFWIPSNTEMGGTIPKELGLLTNLGALNIGQCGMTGTIPPELGNLQKLSTFRAHINQLTGSFPSELANMVHIGLNSVQLYDLPDMDTSSLGELFCPPNKDYPEFDFDCRFGPCPCGKNCWANNVWYDYDGDGDGWFVKSSTDPSYDQNFGDCDDVNPLIFPGGQNCPPL